MLVRLAVGAISIAVIAAAGLTMLGTANGASDDAVELELVADGFDQPLDLVDPDDGSGRLLVVEKTGAVRMVRDGTVEPEPFLDLQDRVSTRSELGLLGLAFDPDFASNSRVYAFYSDERERSVLARFTVDDRTGAVDPETEEQLLVIPQPSGNHNAGKLAFGPDGFLYVTIGDGGANGDPALARDPSSLFGKLLRIDVSPDNGYAVPDDNPFIGDPDARPEVWATGLRNPWRFSFDRETGDLYIGDVGETAFEEVNVQAANASGGQDYGWPTMEGLHCFPEAPCDRSGLTLPVLEYGRSLGQAVVGGYVYRGAVHEDLRGRYVLGDFVAGSIWSTAAPAWELTELADTGLTISAFGEDAAGELYVLDFARGELHRLA